MNRAYVLWALIAAVALAALLAGAALRGREEPDLPRRLTPGLEEQLGRIKRIELADRTGRIALCHREFWQLCDGPPVPVTRAKLRALLLDLARIEVGGARTRDAGQFAAFGLDAKAPRARLLDEAGAPLLDLVAGRLTEGGRFGASDPATAALLLTGVPEWTSAFADWADLPIPRLAPAQLAAIDLGDRLKLVWRGDRFRRADGGPTNEAAAEALAHALAGFAPEAASIAQRRIDGAIILEPAEGAPLRIELARDRAGLWLRYPGVPALAGLWLRAPAFQAAAIRAEADAYKLQR